MPAAIWLIPASQDPGSQTLSSQRAELRGGDRLNSCTSASEVSLCQAPTNAPQAVGFCSLQLQEPWMCSALPTHSIPLPPTWLDNSLPFMRPEQTSTLKPQPAEKPLSRRGWVTFMALQRWISLPTPTPAPHGCCLHCVGREWLISGLWHTLPRLNTTQKEVGGQSHSTSLDRAPWSALLARCFSGGNGAAL